MHDEIRVHVLKYADRENLVMRYVDPLTVRHVTKSAGTANEKAADKAAGAWEEDLRSGRYKKPNRMTWEEFCEYYKANALPALAEASVATYESTLNVFERICKPQKLTSINAAADFAMGSRGGAIGRGADSQHAKARDGRQSNARPPRHW